MSPNANLTGVDGSDPRRPSDSQSHANTGANAASALVDIGVFDSTGKKVAGGKSTAVTIVPMDQAVAKFSIPSPANSLRLNPIHQRPFLKQPTLRF